jgi:hypothetical protein
MTSTKTGIVDHTSVDQVDVNKTDSGILDISVGH